MFTGIVEEKGRIAKITHKKNLSTIGLKAHKITKGIKPGDSVSVDGACLTVARKKNSELFFDMMKETLVTTTLGYLRPNDSVNLERALRMNDGLSGHFVTGHVDCVSTLCSIKEAKNYTEFEIGLNQKLMKYIVPKGSVCIDGVSLTIGKVKKNIFSVYLIPFTLEVTTLGQKKIGDKVNIETDILAKYVLNHG